MLMDIVIELEPPGDDEKVLYDVSSSPPIKFVTRGGRDGDRKTNRQTNRGQLLCYVSYLSVISVVGGSEFNFSQIIYLKEEG